MRAHISTVDELILKLLIFISWVTPPLSRRNRCNHFGAAVREDAPKAPLTTAKEGELAAEALGVADATHGAHGEREDSMPERELLELSAPATARVEAPRHQVRSEKPNEPKRCSARVAARIIE